MFDYTGVELAKAYAGNANDGRSRPLGRVPGPRCKLCPNSDLLAGQAIVPLLSSFGRLAVQAMLCSHFHHAFACPTMYLGSQGCV